jgi:hypothetical protein
MKKMTTLFVVDYVSKGAGVIHPEVREENKWVYEEQGVRATRKLDGTAVAFINGQLYKRYDAKPGKVAPEGAIACCNPDSVSGHHPHWVLCDRNSPSDKYAWEAYDSVDGAKMLDGTYELLGPKIQNDPEKIGRHVFIRHGSIPVKLLDWSFEGIKAYLAANDIEGIAFHSLDGKMCKIRKSDFGLKR